jgi:hypothetical protein
MDYMHGAENLTQTHRWENKISDGGTQHKTHGLSHPLKENEKLN